MNRLMVLVNKPVAGPVVEHKKSVAAKANNSNNNSNDDDLTVRRFH